MSANFQTGKFGPTKETGVVAEFRSHLGGRYRIHHSNLFFTYGLAGTYTINTLTLEGVNPYEAGLFLGLDYQFSRHYLISAKITPYMYERLINKSRLHEFF